MIVLLTKLEGTEFQYVGEGLRHLLSGSVSLQNKLADRSSLPAQEFLARCVHRDVEPDEGEIVRCDPPPQELLASVLDAEFARSLLSVAAGLPAASSAPEKTPLDMSSNGFVRFSPLLTYFIL